MVGIQDEQRPNYEYNRNIDNRQSWIVEFQL